MNLEQLKGPEAQFFRMVSAHDMTFDMSDDFEAYQRGSAELKALEEFARENLPRAKAVEIWNYLVDQKVLPGTRHWFYWSLK